MGLTIDDVQIAEKFIGRFGNPVSIILKTSEEDGGITPEGRRFATKFHNKQYPIKEVLKLNSEYPLGVHFTPNGNFGDNNVRTGKGVQRRVGTEGSKPYRNAMVADFDMKDCEKFGKGGDKEKYLNYLLDNYIDVPGLPTPDLVHKSGGGWHMYWIIAQKERIKISKFLTDKQVSNAFTFAQTVLYGGAKLSAPGSGRGKVDTLTGIDVGKSRFSTSALIRFPGSTHRKTGSPIIGEMYQLYREKTTLFKRLIFHATDLKPEKEFNELTFDMIKARAEKYDEATKVEKNFKKMVIKNSGFDDAIFEKVNKILFPDIMKKLAGYRMTYGGKSYGLLLKGNDVVIERADGTHYLPSGWKYRPEANIINEFHVPAKSIDERPYGNVSNFLYYFFNRNWKLVDEFLNKEFGLKLISGSDEELGVLRHLSVGDNHIMCLPTKIVLQSIVTTGSGNSMPKTTDLFQQPFTVIGKGFTSFSLGQGETPDLEQVFIIKKHNSDEKILLKCYPTKRLRNQDNIGKGLFFYGDDNDLGLFYDAIFNDDTIPEYDIVAKNGYYDGYYVLGGEVFEQGEHKPLFNICKQKGFEFEINKGDQVSIKDYLTKGKKVRDEKIFVPTLLQAIALAGTNIWDRVDSFNQFPGLLLTGYTGSGKTVLHETISLAFGYAKKARTMSISRTSPQPLKQAGIDGSILHLEEFTDPIKPASEDILRDILNRSMSSRGTPGRNIVWQYRSTPFVDGESMPQSESVANRFVIIPVDKMYWKGDTNSIHELQKFSISEELYNKRYELGQDPDKLYNAINKQVNFLTSENINPRAANVWATVFAVNELFDINFSTKKLLEYAKSLMNDVGVDQGDKKRLTPFMRFKIFLAEAVMQRNVAISETVYSDHATISFIFQKEFVTKNIANISKLINEINQQTLERIQKEGKELSLFKPLVLSSPMLSISIYDTNATPTDIALGDLRDRYIRYLPKGVYTYYDGTHETTKSYF